jgi:hypothetical protein
MKAPVILFVYNRVDHVEKTLTALSNNYLAASTHLYIFSDGPKKSKDIENVAKVREFISDEKWKRLFSEVTIVNAERNKGLAASIISGVDRIIRQYGKVIVIEDDCVSSKDFLSFMNDCLDYYEGNKQIWSIGGYSAELKIPENYKKDVYLMGRTCSYAWATWINRWEKVDWDVSNYDSFKWDFRKRKEFNQYGKDRARMLDEQQLGIKNSWAIRFCYAMYENKMYTIYPCKTKIKNIGYDVGTHVTNNKKENGFVVRELSENAYSLDDDLSVNPEIRKEFTDKFKGSSLKLFAAFILNVVLRIKRN